MITTLSQLIAQVESSGNPYAVRYEPAYSPDNQAVLAMEKLARCSLATAVTLSKMSWGLYQIMGDNLIGLGLQSTPIQYCNNQSAQLSTFQAYCVENHCDYTLEEIVTDTLKRLDFARKYNGPGDPAAYAAAMMSAYQGSQYA